MHCPNTLHDSTPLIVEVRSGAMVGFDSQRTSRAILRKEEIMYKVMRGNMSIHTCQSLSSALEEARLTMKYDPILGKKGKIRIVDKGGKVIYNEIY